MSHHRCHQSGRRYPHVRKSHQPHHRRPGPLRPSVFAQTELMPGSTSGELKPGDRVVDRLFEEGIKQGDVFIIVNSMKSKVCYEFPWRAGESRLPRLTHDRFVVGSAKLADGMPARHPDPTRLRLDFRGHHSRSCHIPRNCIPRRTRTARSNRSPGPEASSSRNPRWPAPWQFRRSRRQATHSCRPRYRPKRCTLDTRAPDRDCGLAECHIVVVAKLGLQ